MWSLSYFIQFCCEVHDISPDYQITLRDWGLEQFIESVHSDMEGVVYNNTPWIKMSKEKLSEKGIVRGFLKRWELMTNVTTTTRVVCFKRKIIITFILVFHRHRQKKTQKTRWVLKTSNIPPPGNYLFCLYKLNQHVSECEKYCVKS